MVPSQLIFTVLIGIVLIFRGLLPTVIGFADLRFKLITFSIFKKKKSDPENSGLIGITSGKTGGIEIQ